MEVEVNFLSVLLATIVAMVVGSIWYSKSVFGKEWMKLNKIKEDAKMKKEAPKAMIKMFIGSLITAYVLAHFIYLAVDFFSTRSELSIGLSTAFFAWAGFIFAQNYGSDAFEQRPFKLTMINAGGSLAILLAMGAIIGGMM